MPNDAGPCNVALYANTVNACGRIIAVQEEGLGADLVQGLLLARVLYLSHLGCHELLSFRINLLVVECP